MQEQLCMTLKADMSNSWWKKFIGDFKHPITIGEIGVGEGDSLLGFRDLAHPDSEVHGFDWFKLVEGMPFEDMFELRDEELMDAGIYLHELNQNDRNNQRERLKKLNVNFDIIVDDGGHKPLHHQNSLIEFWPYLNEGGYYIIEDMQIFEAHRNDTKTKVEYEITDLNNTALILNSWNGRMLCKQSPYWTKEEQQEISNTIDTIDRYQGRTNIYSLIRKK